ncbi:uncharacterized protein LOC118194908 [Stegodyphus dumicola]|uniref:uncharacterized protein LOC118194908 n=1 Tax=Stegodyphus dumicola TaxID=202533 RepID=UPI0015A8B02C|nr:uncharacterized protein LOC118194908 [Stegodyphus dumicola]
MQRRPRPCYMKCLREQKKDKSKVPWTEESIKQFEKCKTDLANTALLSYPKSECPLSLCTDASDWAIGSVLQQYEDGNWKPVAFYSKKLNGAQRKYSTYDRELLGIYLSVKQFKYMLEGRDFQIFTDHKPLIFAFKQKNDKASPRQLRQLQMKKQASDWARACLQCQKVKVTRHTKSTFGTYQEPDARFSIIHIDLIGPLPPSNGKIYCLTCIDRFSCWMEVVPLEEITAELVSKAFYDHWVSRFGVPQCVVTDQGRQFTSQMFKNLAAICSAKLLHTTPYHPQCNGKIHRTLKAAIKAHNNRFKDLYSCVFVRVDRVKKPLEPAYDGPFPVAERHDKYYSVHIKGKDVNISIDRLKPAYLMNADSMPELPNQLLDDDVNGGSSKEMHHSNFPTNTRCGREIKLPVRFRT